MAFPASQQRLTDALGEASKLAVQAKRAVKDLRDASEMGSTERMRYVDLMRFLATAIARWGAISTLNGIGAYAQEQYGDGTLDVSVEFSAMVTEATNLRDWIFNNFPKAASGAWEAVSYTSAGEVSHLSFTSAATAEFRARADAFIATVS